MRTFAPLVALFLVVACATQATERADAYPGRPQAFVTVGDKRFGVWAHPTDPTLLFYRASSLTLTESWQRPVMGLGHGHATYPAPIWRAAISAFLSEAHCAVAAADELDGDSWEAHYACPDGRRITEAEAREIGAAHPDDLRVQNPLNGP